MAVHVKGLELPGYEPRTLHAMALGLAVNARGADHNRSGAYEADLSGSLDRLDGGAPHVIAAIATEDRAAAMDSMIFCKFLRGVFGPEPWGDWAELLGLVTGWDLDAEELHATARRIVLAKRMFNVREGWTVGRRLAARAPALRAARDGFRAHRDTHVRAPAHHGGRVLRRARARRGGPPGLRAAG